MKLRFALLGLFLLLAGASPANADGGALRVSRIGGPYRVSVFTSPVPLRVGPVDVSVLVCDAADGTQISDARVKIHLSPRDNSDGVFSRVGVPGAGTNRLFRMASFDLPRPGLWTVAAEVDSPRGREVVTTQLAVSEPLPQWIDLAGWIALPFMLTALYLANEYAKSRRAGSTLHGRYEKPLVPGKIGIDEGAQARSGGGD